MSATSNLPQFWQARFPDTNVTDYLLAVPFSDEKLITPPSFPPLPLSPSDHLIFSSGQDTEICDATIASRGTDTPGLVIKCVASTPSGARFFVKMAINLETGPDSLQYFMTRDILAETRFYALHLQGVAHVPRHYGIFTAKTAWGGRILCQIMEYFDGDRWARTLPNRLCVGRAIQELHDAGIAHGQLTREKQHHILFDESTKCVCFVDFTVANARHCCAHPSILNLSQPGPRPSIEDQKIMCQYIWIAGHGLELWR